jgi:RNA recognition motif-containing protein
MSRKLYVGGLSFDTTDAELRTLFEQVGTVESATIITDRYSGRSKGFGFVEMSTDAAARQAITELNGKTLGERTITVEEARPPGEGRGGPRGRSGGGARW